jgi:hypothetical protein
MQMACACDIAGGAHNFAGQVVGDSHVANSHHDEQAPDQPRGICDHCDAATLVAEPMPNDFTVVSNTFAKIYVSASISNDVVYEARVCLVSTGPPEIKCSTPVTLKTLLLI